MASTTGVTVNINEQFRRGSGGDYSINQNISNRLKHTVFDVTFSNTFNYPGTGAEIDFSRYFGNIVIAINAEDDIQQDVTGDARERYQTRLTPNTTTRHVNLRLYSVTNSDASEESTDSVTATQLRGKTIKVYVLGY